MLDIKLIRENPDAAKAGTAAKGSDPALIDQVLALDSERRAIIQEVEGLKSRRNAVTEEIAKLKRAKENADDKIAEMKGVGDDIATMDAQLRLKDEALDLLLLSIPIFHILLSHWARRLTITWK